MPIWLRNFTWQSINEFYEKKAEAEEEAVAKAKGTKTAKPPTYTTRKAF